MTGDYLILSSDGVAHVLDRQTILPLVRKNVSAEELVKEIVERAQTRSAGYDDDKSVIVLKILEG
jgi:serine/threonine protein phosphatase PrpC